MDPGIQTTSTERRLYLWFAVLMPIIVLAGFARSYYLKGFFGFRRYQACSCICTES